MSGGVTLRVASEKDRNLYKNMFNMYQNELGLYCGEFQDVDGNGYYDAASTDMFFCGDRSVMPLVIEYDGRNVGLAVVTVAPYCPEGYDFCIQEFFVVGYYRGKGIAEAAIRWLFGAMRGKYAAAVQEKNERAAEFFKAVFSSYGGKAEPYGNGFLLFTAET